MKVLMFQPQFAELVAGGSKVQTVRPLRAPGYSLRAGELISARKWTGRAYRSPQQEIAKIRIVSTNIVVIGEHGIIDGDNELEPFQVNEFAIDDGFKDWPEMREWFRSTHGLPFHGELICFELVKEGGAA